MYNIKTYRVAMISVSVLLIGRSSGGSSDHCAVKAVAAQRVFAVLKCRNIYYSDVLKIKM